MIRFIKNSILLFALLAFTSISLAANDNPRFNFKGERTLIVELNDWKNADLNVEIRDLEGNILHSELILKGQVPAIRYNLKNLPVGLYNIILDGGNKKSVNTISVDFNEVRLLPENEKTIFKPTVNFNEKTIDLNYLSLGEKVTISIMDKNGEVFSSEFEGMSTINKRFDISNLLHGQYVFVLSSESQYFTQGFAK